MLRKFKCERCGYQKVTVGKEAKKKAKKFVGFTCPRCGLKNTVQKKKGKRKRVKKESIIPEPLVPQHNWQQRQEPYPDARAALPNMLPPGVTISKADSKYLNFIPEGMCKLTHLGRQAFWEKYPKWAPKYDLRGLFHIFTETQEKIMLAQTDMPIELPKYVKKGQAFMSTVIRSGR